jgi:hypothetical protein
MHVFITVSIKNIFDMKNDADGEGGYYNEEPCFLSASHLTATVKPTVMYPPPIVIYPPTAFILVWT